jgi:hypothetical protein
LRILRLGILAEVAYGMVQDQVSARLCPEYFTVAHPRIEGLTDPTLLGVAWGFLGAWWGGFLLGLALGLTATAGRSLRLSAGDLWRPLLLVLAGQAVVTLFCGFSGWHNARLTEMRLGEPWATLIPPDRHLAFFAVACGHLGSYASAVLGGVLLCGWTAWRRSAERQPEPKTSTDPGGARGNAQPTAEQSGPALGQRQP